MSSRSIDFFADFMMVSVHAHQNSYAFQQYSFDNQVPDFMVEFAHRATSLIAGAQTAGRPWAANVVVPQARAFTAPATLKLLE